MKAFRFCFAVGLISIFFMSCQQSNPYLEMEARELASGTRYDSLFLGLYLGMPSHDFYDHCWKLNKKGIIREGSTNTSVRYDLEDLDHPTMMNFYPGFYQDKIAEMPIVFEYEAWAPWNQHLSSDSLQAEVLTLMEDWFGTGFIEIKNPNDKSEKAQVMINGNRRISIYKKDDRSVKVDIVDLLIKQELDSLNAKIRHETE